jgi:alpha-beta hydrolase superfamily lysophospholipase
MHTQTVKRKLGGGVLKVMAILIVCFAGWLAYKVSAGRPSGTSMRGDVGCGDSAATMANLGQKIPGAPAIACEAWDIGTGVTGYRWLAPHPQAVVLLQHGWADYAQRYVHGGAQLIPTLLANGISVYAFDMWGSGRSPGPRGLTDVDEAVADHLAARKWLEQQPYPVFLMGHSLGGLVSATSVVRDQRRVAGLILLAPALKYDVGAPLRAVARLGGFLIPTWDVPGPIVPPAGVLMRDREAELRLHADPMFGKVRLPWLVAGGGARVSQENLKLYPQIEIPVIALHGNEDRATDPSGSIDFINLVASQDKTLVVLQGARHSFLDDTDGALARDQIIAWIKQRTGHKQ